MITMMLAAAAAAAFPVQDAPQDAGADATRIRSVLLYGDESCPPATSPDEIVVCTRAGESPYRIPERFREQPSERPANTSWVRRVEMIEEVNRAGLPNSCSPIGTGGQTGCTQEQIRQWAQERLEAEARQSRVP
ncbi:hypothetical protein [Sphingosinithalassobacter sp. CS137]|uniref:hypothetical protein n=1 Tax=Sphingosinithalassobacter sp. CS137 TaxID=2762748 RepID=UPI0021CFF47B|nr:hypothetical protein [Sphingosinithalassobacter sp. CS137]